VRQKLEGAQKDESCVLLLGQHQIQLLWIHVRALQEDEMRLIDAIKIDGTG